MARNFTGASSHYLERAGAILTATPLTLACWFMSNSASATQALLAFGNSASANQFYQIRAAGAVAGDPVEASAAAGSSPATAATSTGYTTGTWHHACGVFAATNSRTAYIDGGSSGTNTTSRSPTVTTTNVGAWNNGGTPASFATAGIAEAAVWNVALSADDVLQLARGFCPLLVRRDALVAYWPLSGRHSPETDVRGGADLTLFNGPGFVAGPRQFYVNGGDNWRLSAGGGGGGGGGATRLVPGVILGGNLVGGALAG